MVKIEAFANSIMVGGTQFPKDTLTYKVVRQKKLDLVKIAKLSGTTLALGQYFEYIDASDNQYTNFPKRPWPPEAQSALPSGVTLTA